MDQTFIMHTTAMDSSRDLIAFYAHDGGAVSAGGDGNFYFRVDLLDLLAYAEQGYLDIYVAINVGKPGSGERLLPDDIDTMTNMGWQAVVACYQTNQGTVYVDTDALHNTTGFGQSLSSNGVVARDQTTANGFGKAYFNADLDAVEFSVSRQALLDAGWNGLDASDLLYQVYTTKDGTSDNPVGPGNIGATLGHPRLHLQRLHRLGLLRRPSRARRLGQRALQLVRTQGRQ